MCGQKECTAGFNCLIRSLKKSFSTTCHSVLIGPPQCPTVPLWGGADMIVRSHSHLRHDCN